MSMSFDAFLIQYGEKDLPLHRAVAIVLREFRRDFKKYPKIDMDEEGQYKHIFKLIDEERVSGRTLLTKERKKSSNFFINLIKDWAIQPEKRRKKELKLKSETEPLIVFFYFLYRFQDDEPQDDNRYGNRVIKLLEKIGKINECRIISDSLILSDNQMTTMETLSVLSSEKSQPPLYLPPAEFLDDNKSNWLNPSVENALPFIGRVDELNHLTAFATDGGSFQVWGLSGPSGAGKTRLITKWMREFSEEQSNVGIEWNIGFLDQSAMHLWKNNWEEWLPEKPTFIAIDYIYKSQKIIAEMFHRWRPPHDNKLPFPVRLLLIDHILPDNLAELDKHPWLKAITTGGTDWANKKRLFFSPEPIKLLNDTHNEDDLVDIMKSAAGIFGKQLKGMEISEGIDVLKNTTAAWCPLFAALKGYAFATGAKSKFGDRRDLITYYLNTTNRLPWKDNEKTDAARGLVTSYFVAVATLLRDVPFSSLILAYRKQADKGESLRQELEDIIKRSCWIVSNNDQKILHAFEPDIIGESFFLELYQHIKYPIDESSVFISMLCHVSNDNDAYVKTSEFIGFFDRIMRNLENDNQNDPKVIMYWSMFLDFLIHNNFPKNAPIRQAVSIVLTDVIQALIRCGHHNLANQCLPE